MSLFLAAGPLACRGPANPPDPTAPAVAEAAPEVAATDRCRLGTLAMDYKYVPLVMNEQAVVTAVAAEADAAAAAGACWVRPHLTELFAWGFVERRRGEYDWSVPDAVVRTFQDRGLELLPQIWTSSPWDHGELGLPVPGAAQARELEDLFAAGQHPDVRGDQVLPRDARAYSAWVTTVVERYDGDGLDDMPGLARPILHYEVLNEPSGPAEARPFLDVHQLTRTAARQASEDVRIVLGGQVLPEDLDRLLDMGIAEHCDVINIHWVPTPEEIQRYDRKSGGLPLWVTEMTFLDLGEPGQEVLQARYVVQNHARAFAAGADKIFWIEILGERTPEHPLPPGLPPEQAGSCLWPEGKDPRAGYHAYQRLAAAVSRFDTVEKVETPNKVEAYRFVVDGVEKYVAWAEGSEGTLELPRGSARVSPLVERNPRDAQPERVVEGDGWSVSIPLTADPVLVEPGGGKP